MSHKFPNVFVIIILCLVVIFISGILLPKYLSDQYFQLRSDLNSQKGASKYVLQRNANPNATKQSHSAEENISRLSENPEVVENIQSISNLPQSHAHPVPAPKVKKRSKREAVSKGEELFSWRFNFNLTRHQDIPFTESSKDSLDKSDNENMGIALHAKGKGDKQTVSGDMHNALKSMKMFLNTLLDKNTANIDHKSDDKVIDIREETSIGVPAEQTQHTDLDHTDVDEFSLKKREGKFIFGNLNIFGFGRKSADKSTDFPETSSSLTETDMSTPKPVEITLESVESVENELLQEAQNFQAASPTSESLDIGVIATISSVSDSATDVVIGQNLCLDCPEENPLSTFTSEVDNPEDASKIAFGVTKPAFTDDELEKFCMSYLNKVSETQHSSDPEDGHGFETVHDTINERNLRSSSLNNSQFDLATELNTVNEFGSESDVIEDSFVVSKDELPESDLTRQSKFINFGNLFGLGSGRSAVFESDQFNVLASENDEDPVDKENLPTILDCESYFRTKHSTKFMFPKPNLMDMISDPKIQLTDFDNGTMSGKLKEQNLMFLTGLLKTTFNDSVDITDDSDKFRAKGIETVSEGDKNESENTESIEMVTDGIDVVEKHGTEFDENALNLTDNQRDSRFINFFGFGSGSNEGNLRSDERFFLGSFFGSGSRSLDALDSVIESGGNEVGSGDAFNKISDTLSTNNLENQLETSSVVSFQERQFQGLEFSGDGRQLPEDVITEIFDDKCDDCFYEGNTTELSVDCNENDCDFGNEVVLQNDSLQNTHENCSCVHDTSIKNISFDECDECSFNPADLSDENNDSDGYPSEEILEDTQLNENDVNEWDECAGCAHLNFSSEETVMSERNGSFSECDDCSFNVADNTAEDIKENVEKNMTISDCDTCHFNDSNTYDESYEVVDKMPVSKDNVQRNMREDNEDACDDCGHENDRKQPNERPSLHNTDELLKELTTIKDSESNESTIQLRAGIFGIDTDQSKIENTGESSLDEKTTGNPGRFIGTVFLTGSGDGGLFGDSGGPINLFEEESTIVVPDKSSRRRARLDDSLIDPFEMFTHEVLEQNSMRTLRNPNEETTITVKVPNSRRRGRLDDSLENNLKPQQTSIREHSNVNVETNGTSKDIFVSEVTDAPTVASIKNFNVNEVFTTSRHPNFCTSAMECNAALNEFCITVESSGICGCRRGYVRHKESGECVGKILESHKNEYFEKL